MKKGMLWVVLLVLVLVGAVGFLFFKGKQSAVTTTPKSVEQQTNPVAEKQPSVISSIKDAMGLGEKLRCTYAAGVGKDAVTSTVSVDGQKFLATTVTGGQTMQVLSDGDTQYVWASGSKQGFKMTKACTESLTKDLPQAAGNGTQGTSAPEDYQKDFETAQNVQCEKADNVDFSVPTDVTFTDQCALLEQNKQMMERAKGLVPAGTYPGQY